MTEQILSMVCYGQTSIQLHEKKNTSFLFAALSSWLGLCHRAASDSELTQCLNTLSKRALSSFFFFFFHPISVQHQSGRVHFLSPVQPRPRSHPLDELCAIQSTLCSPPFTLTPSWESHRSVEPAIKPVNGSNTQTHA